MKIWSIALKDLKTLRRDRSALIFTFGMPIILTFVFGSMSGGRNGSGTGFRVLVANTDGGPRGAQTIEAIKSAGLKPEIAPDGASVQKRIDKGDFVVGVVIPPDYSTKFDNAISDHSAPHAALQVFVDPSEKRIATMIEGAVIEAGERLISRQVLSAYPAAGLAMLSGPKLDINVVNKDEKPVTPGDMFLPGFMVYFVFSLANGVAATLLGERTEGTLKRMLVAPVSRFEILAGKLVARGILGLVQTAMLVTIGVEWLNLSVHQAPIGILVTALATIFAACGLGLLMATFGKTMEQIQGMTTMFLLLLGFISGTLIPRVLLPEWMVRLSYITPHAWALNAYSDLIQKHDSLVSTAGNIGVVLLFGIALFGVALTRFRFE